MNLRAYYEVYTIQRWFFYGNLKISYMYVSPSQLKYVIQNLHSSAKCIDKGGRTFEEYLTKISVSWTFLTFA